MKPYATVDLGRGHTLIVDVDDLPLALAYPWRATKSRNTYYARRFVNGGSPSRVLFHRELLGLGPGEIVDHENRNGLDNRRGNLRRATLGQNLANASLRHDNSSGFKGVSWDSARGKWAANIRKDGRLQFLGRFSRAEDAAEAYRAASLELFGEFAAPLSSK